MNKDNEAHAYYEDVLPKLMRGRCGACENCKTIIRWDITDRAIAKDNQLLLKWISNQRKIDKKILMCQRKGKKK